jgi:hypothetical protein
LASDLAKQRDFEEQAKKREEEVQARLKKFGVEPITATDKKALSER